jgi:hypothetical protein
MGVGRKVSVQLPQHFYPDVATTRQAGVRMTEICVHLQMNPPQCRGQSSSISFLLVFVKILKFLLTPMELKEGWKLGLQASFCVL